MTKTNIRPLPGFVLIEPIEDEGKTKGGLYLPDSSKDKPSKGKVVARSDFVPFQGDFLCLVDVPTNTGIPTMTGEYREVREGNVVLYKKWTNQEVTHEGKEYLLVAFSELLAIIE